jgi:hypothetical protein
MKKLFLIILLSISFCSKAQIVRPFIGFSSYLQWDFEKSSYLGLNSGVEFKINRYLLPELEFSYYIGKLQEESLVNNQYEKVVLYSKYASSLNFSFCPKIAIGNKEDGSNFLTILPRYTFSKIVAKGNYAERNNDNSITEQKELQKDYQHSLGLGVGYDISLSDENTSSLSLILYYNGVSLGKVVNKLDHSNEFQVSESGVLGAGINYYFGFKRKWK